MSRLLELSTLCGAVGTGLMAGVYFTFSSFVMRSLTALEHGSGAVAMRSINRVILGSSFMPLFFGTSALASLLAGWGVLRWQQPGGWALMTGGASYLLGMFCVTAACNVPLNKRLDALDLAGAAAAGEWLGYARRWTSWNHVRTAASLLASGLFALALLQLA